MAEPDKMTIAEWETGVCVFIRGGVMRRRLTDVFQSAEFYRARNTWLLLRPWQDAFVTDIYKATKFPSVDHADEYMRAGYPSADYDLYRIRSNAVLVSETRVQTKRLAAFDEPVRS